MPNLQVFRPCDAVETAECWQLALHSEKTPSILALTRQKLKPSRIPYSAKNLCAQGAYEIAASTKKAKAVIFASGSEVEIALDAKALLDKAGIATRVVSVPSMELFEKQTKAYREKVLGSEKIRIAVEAAVRG
jgi:transketolase